MYWCSGIFGSCSVRRVRMTWVTTLTCFMIALCSQYGQGLAPKVLNIIIGFGVIFSPLSSAVFVRFTSSSFDHNP